MNLIEVAFPAELQFEDDSRQVEVVLDVRFRRGKPEYYSPKFGIWQPGEADDVSIKGASIDGEEVPEEELEDLISNLGQFLVDEMIHETVRKAVDH